MCLQKPQLVGIRALVGKRIEIIPGQRLKVPPLQSADGRMNAQDSLRNHVQTHHHPGKKLPQRDILHARRQGHRERSQERGGDDSG
jgi:hypothetical protein